MKSDISQNGQRSKRKLTLNAVNQKKLIC
jgi:hypothetical protein